LDRPTRARYVMITKEEAKESAHSRSDGKSCVHTENQLRFGELIDTTVSETIVGLLGQDASQVFFGHLRDQRGVPEDMVAQRLDMLFTTLDRVFGVASRTVGKIIVRYLCRNLSLKFPENSVYNLSDYVQEALIDYVRKIVLLFGPK